MISQKKASLRSNYVAIFARFAMKRVQCDKCMMSHDEMSPQQLRKSMDSAFSAEEKLQCNNSCILLGGTVSIKNE